MKENFLRLGIEFYEDSDWKEYEIKIVNGLITISGDKNLVSKVRTAFMAARIQLISYLNFYEFYSNYLNYKSILLIHIQRNYI